MKYHKNEEDWQERVYEEQEQCKHNDMESNQCKIEDVGPNEWVSIPDHSGLWRITDVPVVTEDGKVLPQWKWMEDITGQYNLRVASDTVVTRQAVDMRVDEQVPMILEEVIGKYGIRELTDQEKEELYKGFMDQIVYGEEKYHISSEGKVKHIPVFGEEEKKVLQSIPCPHMDKKGDLRSGPTQVYEKYTEADIKPMTEEERQKPYKILGKMLEEMAKDYIADHPTVQTTGPSGITEYPIPVYKEYYSSLEEILFDIKNDLPLLAVEKLENSIKQGKYICDGER